MPNTQTNTVSICNPQSLPETVPGAPQKRERQTEPLGAEYDTLEPIDAAYGAEEP